MLGATPQFTLVAIHKGSGFQLIVGDPNIYYPIGESMFNGTCVANRNIAGDSDTEDRADSEEADALFLCNSMTGCKLPPMRPKP